MTATVPDCTPADECLLLACDVAVRRALELASKRMLRRGFQLNHRLRLMPQYLIYTELPAVTDTQAQDRLLNGAWASLPESMCQTWLVAALDLYTRDLIASAVPHDPDFLRHIIRRQHP